MKKRFHFYIVAGVLLIGLILGSIFDQQINEAIFSRYNVFGLIVSSFGMIPGYGTLAFFGGLLIRFGIHDKDKQSWLRIIFCVLGVAMFGVATYFLGKDVFSVNGFENKQLYWLGFVIMAVVSAGITYFGYWIGSKNTNPRMWIIALIAAGAIFIALVPGVTLFKSLMHRPRYRLIVEGNVDFYNWWERCKEYSTLVGKGGLYEGMKEEFKSFPSGHAGATMCGMILLSYLPLVDNRLMKYQTLFFYIGFGWSLVVMFARSLVGAHFLSDTSFGALLTLICFYIGNEFVVRKCLPKEEEQTTVEA